MVDTSPLGRHGVYDPAHLGGHKRRDGPAIVALAGSSWVSRGGSGTSIDEVECREISKLEGLQCKVVKPSKVSLAER